jgi:hypothetical protein
MLLIRGPNPINNYGVLEGESGAEGAPSVPLSPSSTLYDRALSSFRLVFPCTGANIRKFVLVHCEEPVWVPLSFSY